MPHPFHAFVSKPAAGDTLILYYCGHGYSSPDHRQAFLASYDASDRQPGVRVGSFLVTIERLSKGSQVFIAADHCCSGGMAESVKALKSPRVSYAVFCSAHVNSSSTGAWTFTENSVYGFRDKLYIDDDANGEISIAELISNTTEDMAFADDPMAQCLVRGQVDRQMTIAKSQSKPSDHVGRRAEFLSDGIWYRGFICAIDGDKYRVRYYGYPSSSEEWVTADQIRSISKRTFPVDAKVKALSADEWYDAKIVAVRDGLHHVKFDGWEREWNEWVPAERIRLNRRRK